MKRGRFAEEALESAMDLSWNGGRRGRGAGPPEVLLQALMRLDLIASRTPVMGMLTRALARASGPR